MTTEFHVKPADPVSARSIKLSPIDRLHAPIRQFDIFCFQCSSGSSKDAIADALFKGLSVTLSKLPHFLGKLVDVDGEGEGAPPVKALDIAADASVRLICKDYEDPEHADTWTAGTYAELEAQGMPCSALSTSLLAQHATDPEDTSVLGLQANFIPGGGLLLAVITNHAVCDGNGLSLFLKAWAAQTTRFSDGVTIPTPDLLEAASLERHAIAALGTKNVDITKTPEGLMWTKDMVMPDFSAGIPSFGFAIWRLSADKAAALKKAASASPRNGTDKAWVSTGDAYTALLWQRYAAARAAGGKSTSARSNLFFPLNFRQRVEPALPTTYAGNAIIPRMISSTPEELQSQSLHTTASAVRSTIASVDDRTARKYVGFLDGLPNIGDVLFDIDLFGADLAITNWDGLGYMQTEWGVAMSGRPRILRRAGDSAVVGGVAVILPKAGENGTEGAMEVMTCFEKSTTEWLRKDAMWSEYLEFVAC